MNYPFDTELTGSRLLRIWWALIWRTTALGGLFNLIEAWIIMRLVASGGMRIVPWLSVVSWLLYGGVFLGVLRSVLKKRFRDFSLRLVKEP